MRFTPLRLAVAQTHPLSGLISRPIYQRRKGTQIELGVIIASSRSPGNTPLFLDTHHKDQMKNAEASVVCDESTECAGQVNDEQQCLRNTVKEECDAWLRLPEIRSVDVMASLDPLEWWKMHNTQFPTIAKLARKYLHGYSCIIRPFRESVFKSQVDPGESAMEPTSGPTPVSISSPKA